MSQPDEPVATVSPEVNKETKEAKEKRLSTDSDSDSDKENVTLPSSSLDAHIPAWAFQARQQAASAVQTV